MSFRHSPLGLLALLAVSAAGSFVTACSSDDDTIRSVPNLGDPAVSPTMSTTDVNSLVSDSGYVKYHIVTKRWDMYEDLQDPFWKFPVGLKIETYRPDGEVNGEITADTVFYFHQRRLAKLIGNVLAVNTMRDTFLTNLIYWDQARTQFYTDSFIHIVKSDRIIEGYGFTANEQMTEYTIHHPTAIIPASALRGENRGDRRPAADSADIPVAEPFESDVRARRAPEPASIRNMDRDKRNSARSSGSQNIELAPDANPTIKR